LRGIGKRGGQSRGPAGRNSETASGLGKGLMEGPTDSLSYFIISSLVSSYFVQIIRFRNSRFTLLSASRLGRRRSASPKPTTFPTQISHLQPQPSLPSKPSSTGIWDNPHPPSWTTSSTVLSSVLKAVSKPAFLSSTCHSLSES